MSAEQLRFRCFRCGKLLGVSASKAGRIVACPACSIELIVPGPDKEEEDREEIPSLSIVTDEPRGGSEFRVRGDSPTSIMTEPTPSRPVFPLEPESKVESTVDIPALGFLQSDAKPTDELPLIEASPPGPLRERDSRRVGRDVLLPRGVVAAWSLLAILAVGFAFAAGVLVGKFLWRG